MKLARVKLIWNTKLDHTCVNDTCVSVVLTGTCSHWRPQQHGDVLVSVEADLAEIDFSLNTVLLNEEEY